MQIVGPDTKLVEAIMYLITGRWGSDADSEPVTADELWEALKAFHQLAFDGRIAVWGEKIQSLGLVHRIPASAWESNTVEATDLFRTEARTRMSNRNHDAGFDALRVSKVQWTITGLRALRDRT
nr:hypothetical protein JKL49_06955 [Phenylobacterium glaciei]